MRQRWSTRMCTAITATAAWSEEFCLPSRSALRVDSVPLALEGIEQKIEAGLELVRVVVAGLQQHAAGCALAGQRCSKASSPGATPIASLLDNE